jgi:hypothetical protein
VHGKKAHTEQAARLVAAISEGHSLQSRAKQSPQRIAQAGNRGFSSRSQKSFITAKRGEASFGPFSRKNCIVSLRPMLAYSQSVTLCWPIPVERVVPARFLGALFLREGSAMAVEISRADFAEIRHSDAVPLQGNRRELMN